MLNNVKLWEMDLLNKTPFERQLSFLNQDKLLDDDDSEWKKLNVISRADQATGKNKHLMNVALEQGKPFWLDFEHGVLKWKESKIRPTRDDEYTFGDKKNIMISSSDYNLETAKKENSKAESKKSLHQGQPRISTRWVYTYKNPNDKQVCKARLEARGFQDRDVDNIRNDSPTCSKEDLRIALAIMASNHWMCKSMDIKTAFLQSKELNWLVYLDPPKEANMPPGYIWKLSKWLNWCIKILIPDTQRGIIEMWSSSFKIWSNHIYMVFWKQTA